MDMKQYSLDLLKKRGIRWSGGVVYNRNAELLTYILGVWCRPCSTTPFYNKGERTIMRFMQNLQPRYPLLIVLLVLLAACSPIDSIGGNPTPTATATPKPKPTHNPTRTILEVCPAPLDSNPNCYTPRAFRQAYDVEALTEQGFTGKGQTVIDIVSYGSPTLQQDMDVFDKQFGLPQFLKLEQYAVAHHLGQIFSQSYVASEATLAGSAGQKLVKTFADFYKQITTRQGFTIVSGSGDNGATDWANIAATKLSPRPTVNFPADVPWVTAVGGTTLRNTPPTYDESAWSGSGGGMSTFFAEPAFQKSMPSSVQSELAGHRGLPDIAGDANPETAMVNYIFGHWTQIGGTSASTPFWAGIVAIANQVAGHSLGFINPALYKLGASPNAQKDFRDIINGSNNVDNGNIHVKGFQAVQGWDAVTGWGSPRASQFISDLIAAMK